LVRQENLTTQVGASISAAFQNESLVHGQCYVLETYEGYLLVNRIVMGTYTEFRQQVLRL
jgi:hypothetical protein